MKKTGNPFFLILVLINVAGLFIFFTGCSKKLEPISILSEEEHQFLEPVIQEFARKHRTDILIEYSGPVKIVEEMEKRKRKYNAVWPASSLWLDVAEYSGEEKHRVSVFTTPVVFGIRQSAAKTLGLNGNTISIENIIEATGEKKFGFLMPSAAHSTCGATAYLGFMHALAKKSDMLTREDLGSESLRTGMKKVLGGVRRTSGSVLWLNELFLESEYNAIITYEALLIEMNRALETRGEEPLLALYPDKGTFTADSTLCFLGKKGSPREETFLELQKYLLSDEVQDFITKRGRRTQEGIFSAAGEKETPDWASWNVSDRIQSHGLHIPGKTAEEAFELYQTRLKKPSFTFFCLDASGSMAERGGIGDLKEAMRPLLHQKEAADYMIRTGKEDITIVLPFSIVIFDQWIVRGNSQEELDDLYNRISHLKPSGYTDIYTPVITALDMCANIETLENFLPAIYLMTDGLSDKGRTFSHIERAYSAYGLDIPIFTILYGDADENQLREISALSGGRVFDGRDDLKKAFIAAKAYN